MTTYNNIATITGTIDVDFYIDSGILYILTDTPTLTFNESITTPLNYQDNTVYKPPSGYYGSIVGFYVLVGPGGSGANVLGGGGGGGGGIVIQNNYPFFNNGTYSFQVGTYNNKHDTTLSFTPINTTKVNLYTATKGSNGQSLLGGGSGGAGGSGSMASNGTNTFTYFIYDGTYINGAGGGHGVNSGNGINGGQGVHLLDHGVSLDIWCSAGGGGASNVSGNGGNAGNNGGGGGGGGGGAGRLYGNNSQDYYTTYTYGGGGGGGSGGYDGKNGVIIIYATCYQYSLKQLINPSFTGYTVNGIPLGYYFLPKTTNAAPVTNYKYNGKDLNTIFEGYLNGDKVITTTVTKMKLQNSVDIANYFNPQPIIPPESNLSLTSGYTYFLNTKSYYIYYFISDASFNYTGSNDLYAVIVGGGGGSGGVYSNIDYGSGGGGGGGISMCKYMNTQGSTLNLTFSCGAGGSFAANGNGTPRTGLGPPGPIGGIGGTSKLSGVGVTPAVGTNTAVGGCPSYTATAESGPTNGGAAGNYVKVSSITLPTGVYSYGSNSSGSDATSSSIVKPGFPTGFTLQIESQLFFLASGGQGGYNSLYNSSDMPNTTDGWTNQKAMCVNPWGSGYGGLINSANANNGLDGTGSGASGMSGTKIGGIGGIGIVPNIGGMKGGSGCCIVFFKNKSI